MNFTASEFGAINFSIVTTPEMKERTFPISELGTAISIADKLKVNVDAEGKNFVDGDVDFSTEEKSIILKLLDREFSIEQGKSVLSLKTKLA